MNNTHSLDSAVLERLDVLIRLQARSMTENFESQKDKVIFLSKIGLSPTEIAVILDTTPNNVSVTLTKVRKAGTKSKKKVV